MPSGAECLPGIEMTADGAKTWPEVKVPTNATLQQCFFLTDQIGWAVRALPDDS